MSLANKFCGITICVIIEEHLQILQGSAALQDVVDVSAWRPSLLMAPTGEQSAPPLALGRLVQVRVVIVVPGPEPQAVHFDVTAGV